ncbi:MAG: serine hydrolase, partial [Gemmatimonadetes bacterium]|nr:serine hydrolase [Gemmatimonadota bacterium]
STGAPAGAAPRPATSAVLFWNQQQREAWFSVMDTLFPVHVAKASSAPRPLRAGAPISALAPGGAQAAMLDAFMTEQKVAGLLVLHDGAIRLERYAMGYGPGQKWTSFSVAKSFTSTLVGAAVKDGYIKSLDDPVTKYITAMRGSAYDDVTIRQLLTMTSGVRWNEDYTDPRSDVAMLFSTPPDPGLDATVSYMRKLPREASAGTKWVYKTGETNLIGNLVMEATHKSLAEYLSEKVWSPAGMETDATWIVDLTGHEVGGCCLQASLRDYARFGQFILDGAKVNGRSILPDGWLEAATTNQVTSTDPFRGYGYQWWTEDQGRFMAIGIHGQSIHVDPARKLIIVMNSAWPVATGRDRSIARAQFWRTIESIIDSEGK